MYSNKDFELGLAYRIGQKIAYDEYLEKEASMQAVKAFGSGLKGVVTGSGKTIGEAFRTGAGGKGFKQVAQDFGKGIADPWKRAYGDLTRRRATALRDTHRANIASKRNAQAAFDKLKSSGGSEASLLEAQAALTKAQEATTRSHQAIQSKGGLSQLRKMVNNHQVPLSGKDYGTMAVGALGATAAGVGAYNVGKSALGYNQQPQVAPHQYYANQMRNWWNNR